MTTPAPVTLERAAGAAGVAGVAVLTLNRPDRLNAMSWELVDALHATLAQLKRPESPHRVVVLRGAGRGFCSGADLAAARGGVGGKQWAWNDIRSQEHFASIISVMRSIRQPIIALVHGAAAGGGMALALASDVRVAGESAKFVPAFTSLGMSGCELGTSFFLPRLVGASNAALCLMTGDAIDAAAALRIGLVSKVVSDADLLDEGVRLASRIAQGSSEPGLALTKRQLNAAADGQSLEAALAAENTNQVLCLNNAECAEFGERAWARMLASKPSRPPDGAADPRRPRL